LLDTAMMVRARAVGSAIRLLLPILNGMGIFETKSGAR